MSTVTYSTLFVFVWDVHHVEKLAELIGSGKVKLAVLLHPIFVLQKEKKDQSLEERFGLATLPYVRGFVYAYTPDGRPYLVYTGSSCNKVYGALFLLVFEESNRLSAKELAESLGLEKECKILAAYMEYSFSYLCVHKGILSVDVSLNHTKDTVVKRCIREAIGDEEVLRGVHEHRVMVLPVNNYTEKILYSQRVDINEITDFCKEYKDFLHKLIESLRGKGVHYIYILREKVDERYVWRVKCARFDEGEFKLKEEKDIEESIKNALPSPPKRIEDPA